MAKAKKTNNDVISVEAEVMDEIPASLPAVIEKYVSTEVDALKSKYENRLDELKEKYGDLVIADKNDRDGYESVRAGIADLRSIRVNTDNDRKEKKAILLKAGKTIEEKAQWIISEVTKIEEPLQQQKDNIDAEKERDKQERIKRESARLVTRTAQLKALGADFNGADFVLEDVSYELAVVRESDDDIFDSVILPKYKSIFDVKEAARLEQERIKKEEDDRIIKGQEEMQEQQRKLKEEQDKLAEDQRKMEEDKKRDQYRKEQEEKERITARTKARSTELQALGLQFNFSENAFMLDPKLEMPIVRIETVLNKSDEEWNLFILDLIPEVHDINILLKKEAEEKAAKEKQDAIDKALEEEKKKQEQLKLDEAKKKEDEELKRKAELEKAGDKANWDEFISKIAKIEFPLVKSGQYRKIASIAREKLEEILSLRP